MRTTINLDEELLEEAGRLTGITERTTGIGYIDVHVP